MAHDACFYRFREHGKLRDALLATGDALLVEGSPTDAIWGLGFAEEQAMEHRHQWGSNLLALPLMRVRETLRAQPER